MRIPRQAGHRSDRSRDDHGATGDDVAPEAGVEAGRSEEAERLVPRGKGGVVEHDQLRLPQFIPVDSVVAAGVVGGQGEALLGEELRRLHGGVAERCVGAAAEEEGGAERCRHNRSCF